MWELTQKDFEIVESWGLTNKPFAAVEDYTPLRAEQRWENPEQQAVYEDYVRRRNEYIQKKDFDDYYKKAEKPIDKERWEFLMNRKAWYIMPLGWESIAKNGGTVADLGCGDGDTIQRLITFTLDYWNKNNITDKKLHIVGLDLNRSRIENAQKLVETKDERITLEFDVADLVGKGLDYSDKHFDFSLICGVLEILNDEQCDAFMNEMCRVTKNGLYIEDLFEKFPGGHPRDYLGRELLKRDFKTKDRHVVLSEPFSTEKLSDPKKLWPMLLVQNIWAER